MFRLGLCLALVPAALTATDLATTLANMDRAEARFKGMSARVMMVRYTALVDDRAVNEGDMVARRNSANDVDMKIHFDTPFVKDLLIQGTKVEIYSPKIAVVEEYDLSNSREKVEQALLSGFGVKGSYLSANYDIKLAGDEAVGSHQAVKLEMIPTDPETRRRVPKAEMWISTETWQPVQQKLYQASNGDYELYRYSDVSINPAIKDSAFRIKTEGKVKRITPGR